MNVRIRSATTIAIVALVTAACAAGSTPVPSATATATPTPSPSPSPSPKALPTTAGTGPAYVTGTQTHPRIERGTATQVGDVMQPVATRSTPSTR